MNQFSLQQIRKLNKQANFPSSIVDKECLIYKELLFDENPNLKGIPNKNLSECFLVETSNKEDESKATPNRGWKGNENNRKAFSKNLTNNNNNTTTTNPQTGWKASKYVNNTNQEQANNSTQNQTKPIEDKPKQIIQTSNQEQTLINKNLSEVNQNKKNENDSDDMETYFINSNSNNTKTKSFNSNLEKELDKNVKDIIKSAIEDEESLISVKEPESNESVKKAKKKKKKSKNKLTKESDNKMNITNNSELQDQNETLNFANQKNLINSSIINQSDLSMINTHHQMSNGQSPYFANYPFNQSMLNNNNNNNNNINFLNDTMLMPNNQIINNYNNDINNKNNNFINNILDDSIMNNTNNILDNSIMNNNNSNTNNNNNPNVINNSNTNQSSIPMFAHNLLHPMQAGIFLNPNAPKVIYPQIDPSKNLNFFLPNTNIFHASNMILEPVEIENIYKFNKKFNIFYEQSIWYIFNPMNASMSLPLSSKQIFDMYSMKIINGEIDFRPIDVFQFKGKNAFAFSKLKTINDANWIDEVIDAHLLCSTDLFKENENLKNKILLDAEKHKNLISENNNNNKNEKQAEIKQNGQVDYMNNFNNNNNNNFNGLGSNKEEEFEVVGAKKGKNAVVNNNISKKGVVNNFSEKKPAISQAANNNVNNNNNKFVPVDNLGNAVINKNDFNSINSKNSNALHKPVMQNVNINAAKNIQKPVASVIPADETLNFAESIIQAKGFENNINLTNQEIIAALDKNELAKDHKKTALNNILIEAEDWEVVDKRKKLKQNKEKEKEKANLANTLKVTEIKEELKAPIKKAEDSVDIVEKLKMNNPYYQSKEVNTKPQNSIDALINNNKFEVVVKKKKKKDDGKSKPPGNFK